MNYHSNRMYDLIDRNILGALCIVFATAVSRFAGHEYLSPLLFSMGILLVIIFDLGLVTRSVPSGDDLTHCICACCVNLVTAGVLGTMYTGANQFAMTFAPPWEYLLPAVGTGIIIGLVSLVNKHHSEYTVLMTMMLMFSFVYLKLPHCVVYAVYVAANRHTSTGGASALAVVTLGNIIGGLIVRFSGYIIREGQASLTNAGAR